jgi:3-hydroxyacyl-CoA dehydrogenase
LYENWLDAKRVCVIGAGTMGSGIAAHLANIGFQVTLLDVTKEACEAAFDRSKQAKPPHFFVQERAGSIRLGGIDENLDWTAEADWICEAIIEKLEAKQALFAALESYISPDAMITTNTSGLQISLLVEGRSEGFRQRFVGTHFFNPPRYLKLLELIPTDETHPDAVKWMTKFLELHVARRVVLAKDTPGFIANRYGMWSMFQATRVAERLRLTAEQVDLITGTFLGRPKSGTFRLNDIVGLDIMQDVAQNLIDRCPDDPHVLPTLQTTPAMAFLMEKGWIGEKFGHGFYRREGKELLVFDWDAKAYRQRLEPSIPSIAKYGDLPLGQRIAATLKERDEAGEFLREYLVPALRYADYLKDKVSHSILDFDRVMMWGFGWEVGPFSLIDAIGGKEIGLEDKPYYQGQTQRTFAGTYAPIAVEADYLTLAEAPIIDRTDTYIIRDLGDGISALSINTKLGLITPALVDDLIKVLETKKLDRFVFSSEAKVFSVGYDLKFFDTAIEHADRTGIDANLAKLQRLGELLESHRCVAAICGYTLGAGLELAMSCPIVVSLGDAQIGLPEVKVGLLPGGRGITLMRLNNQTNGKRLTEAAVSIASGSISASADEARQLGYLRSTDVTCYHPDRLISTAKNLAKTVEATPRTGWANLDGPINGLIDREMEGLHQRGSFTDYDKSLGDKIRFIFAKGTSYENALELERREFTEMAFRALSQARVRHMLENGKPLRN